MLRVLLPVLRNVREPWMRIRGFIECIYFVPLIPLHPWVPLAPRNSQRPATTRGGDCSPERERKKDKDRDRKRQTDRDVSYYRHATRSDTMRALPTTYRGTPPIRNSALLGPYSRTMHRALWKPLGGGLFLMSEVPL